MKVHYDHDQLELSAWGRLLAKLTMTAKSTRRKLPYCLRTLPLVVLVLILLFAGWLGVGLQRAKKQHQAVLALQEAGMRVIRDFPAATRSPLCPSWGRRLLMTDFFASVIVVRVESARASSIGDDDLIHLESLPDLIFLCLGDSSVTDEGLIHLRGLHKLEGIDLRGTKITDAGLVYLKRLRSLNALLLERTEISDAAFNDLTRALPNTEMSR